MLRYSRERALQSLAGRAPRGPLLEVPAAEGVVPVVGRRVPANYEVVPDLFRFS